jgi:hypothetical protein
MTRRDERPRKWHEGVKVAGRRLRGEQEFHAPRFRVTDVQ